MVVFNIISMTTLYMNQTNKQTNKHKLEIFTLDENHLTFSFSFQTQSDRQSFSPVLELHPDDEVDDAERLEDVLVEEPQLVIEVLGGQVTVVRHRLGAEPVVLG